MILKSIRHYLKGGSLLLNSLIRVGATQQCILSLMATREKEELQASPRNQESRRLAPFEHKTFSQHGEDGIINEIFRRIGTTNRQFAEVGVHPLENNTLFLANQGWSGAWIDGGLDVESMPEPIRKMVKSGQLRALSELLTRENIAEILRSAGVGEDLDLLSLDVDMNTYALWEGLASFHPRVVVVEYNASMPPWLDWRVAYQPDAVWNGSTYFGASLKAFEKLGAERGYKLVGCDLSGANAFFVRGDVAGSHFLEDDSAENHYEPPRYHLYTSALGYRPGVGPSVVGRKERRGD